MQAFRDVSVFPSHSTHTAIVAWVTDPALKDAEFYVYRKWDGGATWELLNEEAAYGTTYADTNFDITNKQQVPMYKVLALVGEKEYVSPEVGVFGKVTRKDFGVAQNIIRSLYLQARRDGTPVLYYPAIKNGKMSSSLDSATETKTDSCTSSDYGTNYEGGYYRPFLTYVRMLGAKLVRSNRLDDGNYDENVQQVQFLAFPPVRSEDLVVDVATDRRWLVAEGIQAQMVRAVIPVSYTTTMSLQSHSHPCYSVPIPDNYPALIRRLTYPEIP